MFNFSFWTIHSQLFIQILIDEAKKVGWSRFKRKKKTINELDIKGVFKLGNFLFN